MSQGTLFVVATPIGNLDDLSPRAREVLASVELVAAEDTRVTGRLLSHFGIDCRLSALHEHNEKERSKALVRRLEAGESIALVSDAGTPLISDPGFNVVRRALAAGITVSPVPGPSALIAALSASGLPTDRFVFEGFLPAKKGARAERLAALEAETRPMIFYESVHRIDDSLADMAVAFGAGREAFIGRELTKLHEQCVAAPLGELAGMIDQGDIPRKGEFVVIVAGGSADVAPATDVDRLLSELLEVMPGKQAANIASRVTGGNRNEIYQRMLALKAGKS